MQGLMEKLSKNVNKITMIGSVGAAVAIVLGAQVVWPRERLDTLAAQESRTAYRVDSTNFRIDSVKLRIAERNLLGDERYMQIIRQLNTLSILACGQQVRNSIAFQLAECQKVLNGDVR